MGYTGYVGIAEARRIVARAIEAGLRYNLVDDGNGNAFVSVFTRSEGRGGLDRIIGAEVEVTDSEDGGQVVAFLDEEGRE